MWTPGDLYALTHIYARFTDVSGAYCCRFWLYRVCKTLFCLHSLSLYFKALEAWFGNPWFTWKLLLESSILQEGIFHFHFPIHLFPSLSLPARSVSTNHILQAIEVKQKPLTQGSDNRLKSQSLEKISADFSNPLLSLSMGWETRRSKPVPQDLLVPSSLTH